MWTETIDGNLVNMANATGIQTSQQGETFQVDAEVVVQHQSRNSMRTLFRGSEPEFNAFMDALKGALPMLPIGKHKPKQTPKATTRAKTSAKAKG